MGKRGTSTAASKKASIKSQKKSKGPKGKKARAKAKLERQWGEQVLVDPKDAANKKSSWRMGPSRLLHQQLQKKKDGGLVMTALKRPEIPTKDEEEDVAVNSDEGEDSTPLGFDDESESGDEGEDAAQSYSTLIHSIRDRNSNSGQKHKNADMDVVIDDDDDASNSPGSTGDDEMESSAHDCTEENDENYLNITIPSVDPFTARFSPREELPESTVKENASSRHKEMVKINSRIQGLHDGGSDPIVDVQVSKHLAEALQLPAFAANDKNSSSTTSEEVHKQRACKFLNSFYRPALLRNTMLDKKGWLRRPYHHHNIVFPILSSYADMLWTTSENLKGKNYQLSEMILTHALNHVVTSRARIYRHDKRLLEEASDDVDTNTNGDDAWKRDQGFTRPTVLILLPTRHCCYQMVQQMQVLLSCATATSSGSHDDSTLQRFALEYGPPPPPPADAIVDEVQERHRQKVLRQKGPSWNALFGDDCNSDDDFKLGLALHLGKKQSKNNDESSNISIKLFTDFYRSDIILASPLGLKMAIDDSPDFLSSIEICVVDRAEVLLEQNWDHVHDVLGMLNQEPRSHNETDFSRVRPYFLQPQISQHFRQVVVCSTVKDPAILSTFKRYSMSVSGVVRVKERYPVERASVSNLVLSTSSNGDAIRQAFQRVSCTSFATQSDDRVNYFVERVLPHLERTQQTHTMVFIPSYFDFLSLRNALMQRQKDYATALNFVSVTEYARATEVSRGRARFLQGRRPLLLYTGRAHFFLRHRIRGVRHLIFLGLPVHAEFYVEHVNRLLVPENHEGIDARDMMGDASAAGVSTCLALYTPYEAHALERIVGTSNCSRMVQGEKATHVFSSS